MTKRRAMTLVGALLSTAAAATSVPVFAQAQPTGSAQVAAAAPSKGPKAQSPKGLSSARQRMNRARRALLAAQRHEADVATKSENARSEEQSAKRELGTLAREAYAGGASDLLDIATLVTADNPRVALRDASRAAQFAYHQSDDWNRAAEVVQQFIDARAEATSAVRKAEKELRSAQEAVIAAQGSVGGGGPGAARLAQRCAAAKSVSPICVAPPWTERNLTADSVLIGRYVSARWPKVKEVGGWRPSDPFPDHPSGRAVDIMMPNGGSGADAELGNEIAAYFQEHAKEYGIYYILWRQRMWLSTSRPGAWTGMSDRGSPTANHMDHIHISVTDGHSATIVSKLLKSRSLPK
jgi:hypothetical protein